jgi:hypothetical protein
MHRFNSKSYPHEKDRLEVIPRSTNVIDMHGHIACCVYNLSICQRGNVILPVGDQYFVTDSLLGWIDEWCDMV